MPDKLKDFVIIIAGMTFALLVYTRDSTVLLNVYSVAVECIYVYKESIGRRRKETFLSLTFLSL